MPFPLACRSALLRLILKFPLSLTTAMTQYHPCTLTYASALTFVNELVECRHDFPNI